MARTKKPAKKITTIEEEIEDDPVPVPYLVERSTKEEIPVDASEEQLSRVIRKYGEEGLSIRVSMMRPSGWTFLGAFTNPDDADEEALQRRFSSQMPPDGGEFKIDVLVNGEPRYQRRVIIAPLNGGGIAPAMAGGGSRVESLLERVLDRLSNPPAQPQQSSALELAQAVAAVRETAPPPPDPMANVTAMFGLMKNMFEMSRSMAGGGGNEDRPWWREVIDEVKPLAGPIVAGYLKAQNGNGEAPPPQPAAQNGNGAMEIPGKVTDEEIKAILSDLKGYAKKYTVEFVLQYIESNAENDPKLQSVVRAVSSKNFEYFASIDPEIAGPVYGDWFRDLYDGLRSLIFGEDPVDTDTGGTGGNNGNAPAHAKPRGKGGKGSKV